MSAKLFNFPDKEKITWHHIAPAVHEIALERSCSQVIVARVVDVVRQAYERSVPPSFAFNGDSIEAIREEATEHLHQIVGAMIAELTMSATDAEMRATDHDPHNHRAR